MKVFAFLMTISIFATLAFAQDNEVDDKALIDDTKSSLENSMKAPTKEEQAEIGKVSKAIEQFYTDCGRFPTKKEGLNALVSKPKTSNCKAWGKSAAGNPYIASLKYPTARWDYKVYGSKYSLSLLPTK